MHYNNADISILREKQIITFSFVILWPITKFKKLNSVYVTAHVHEYAPRRFRFRVRAQR
jgi:hypothetical protein